MSIENFFTSGYGFYTGTEKDIKRSFDLNHKSFPIFKRFFDASDPNIVSIASSTIKIRNHFFTNGEEVKYSYGALTNSPIGIVTTDFGVGIGITDKLPSSVYIIKVDNNTIKLAKSAEDALRSIAVPLNLSSVGIGSSHSFTCTNQNPKVLITIDNIIQSPLVSTATSTYLLNEVSTIDDVFFVETVTNYFNGDYIKINNEIMKIEAIGVGSTNAVRVIRSWAGTDFESHSIGSTITKLEGNYNIIDNTIHFVEAPYGNVPQSGATNSPDEQDWVGVSTSSSFHGRSFMRSGIPDTTNNAYYKNFAFDDISNQFNGIDRSYILTSGNKNVVDIFEENSVILINNIFQGPGLQNNYTLNEISGITSVTFNGSPITNSIDVNTSDLPSGGLIVSIASTEGFGYQPLISAGGTCVVSISGTISNISIGNSGSGYRTSSQYDIISSTSSVVSAGSTIITVDNLNSIYDILNITNTGSNCTIGLGTYIKNATITSIGSTFICIGIGNTIQYAIPEEVQVIVNIKNPITGIVMVGVCTNNTGISTFTHVGFSTIINGRISKNVTITNPGYGFTSSNIPDVLIDSPLSYSNIPLIYSQTSSGIGTQSTIDIIVGQDSSVIEFEIRNLGYGYKVGDVLTIPTGGYTGIPLLPGLSFKEFQITVEKTFVDKFSGWSMGVFQPLDDIKRFFNGRRTNFTLTYLGDIISIYARRGSDINIQDTLLVFINDILQIPGEGYIFNGGSKIQFTEAPKPEDNCKIIFYKGSGDGVDVIFQDILETVKIGDDLTLTYDPSIGQPAYLLEDERFVTDILSIDTVNTNPYFGPGNTENENLTRPIIWCRQTEDLLINDKNITKDRILYEPQIYPYSYVISSVGIGSSVIFVDNIRPFFNSENENNVSLEFQKNVTMISQDIIVGAYATCVVSSSGTISSLVINNGGYGYKSPPNVFIQKPPGLSTTTQLAVSSISSGIVTSINVVGSSVTGYSQSNPPLVLIEEPTLDFESNKVISYSGDSGFISGISTISVGTAYTGIAFDLVVPIDSYLRDDLVSEVTTISGIQTGYYFVIYNSNVGNGVVSLNSDGSILGISTNYLDGVYEASSVSIAQTSVVGMGLTNVLRVVVSVSDYNGLSGIGYSGYYGNYSWGRIFLRTRTKTNEYKAYTMSGYSGITTGAIVRRTSPLKYLNYST